MAVKKFFIFLSIHIIVILTTLIIPEIWTSWDYGIWIGISLIILRYAVTFVLSIVFYSYQVDKCNLFLLPLSFVPLPFILIPLIVSSKAGNVPLVMAFNEVIYFSVLFFLLTIIVSVILQKRKKKRQGLPIYQSDKTPKYIVLIGCIVFSVLTAIFIYGIISFEMRQQRNTLYTTYTEVLTLDMEGEWTSVHTDFLGTLPPESRIFEISLSNTIRHIENTKTQQDFESAFNVTLPELNFKDYYYIVLVGHKAPPNLENGWRPERLENVNQLIVYRVNIVR